MTEMNESPPEAPTPQAAKTQSRAFETLRERGELEEISTEIKFACGACGGCCRGVEIPITPFDAESLAGALGVPTAEFVARFMGFVPGPGMAPLGHLKMSPDGACPMLRGDGLCRVHQGRPLACRLYPLLSVDGEDGRVRFFMRRTPPCKGFEEAEPVPLETYLGSQGAGPYLEASREYRKKAEEFSKKSLEGPKGILGILAWSIAFQRGVGSLYAKSSGA